MRSNRPRITSTLFCVFCASVVHAQQPQPPVAVPKLVRFSGSFRPASGTPTQTMESVTLSVYRDQTGGDALWHEIQNVVVDTDGHYSVLMGATKDEGMPVDLFASGEPRWLGVQFNRAGEAEQPRTLLVSVPYALKSADADTLGGKPASAYLLAAPAAPTPAVGADAASVAGVSSAASTTTPVKPKATPANNGQPNYIGKFTNTTDLIDSAMYETGGKVGIFTTAPLISLDVRTGSLPQMGIAGTFDYLTFFASDVYGPAIYWDPNKDMRFGKGGTGLYSATGFVEQMRIQSSTGNVGIGTQTPGSKLEVDTVITNETAIFGYSKYGTAISGSSVVSTGVYGESVSVTGNGVSGVALSGTGSAYGVAGVTRSPQGGGVSGENIADTGGNGGTFDSRATSGSGNGVYGQSASPNGSGVFGINNATTGYAVGVNGQTNSPTGIGVNGLNTATSGGSGGSFTSTATSGNTTGVVGNAASPKGAGVLGTNIATSGFATGVTGVTNSPAGTGVAGLNNATSGGSGGNFTSTATSGNTAGVVGYAASPNGAGVLGVNNAITGYAVGVNGQTNSPTGIGVNGQSTATSGGIGGSFSNAATSGNAIGVVGNAASPNGIGVLGTNNAIGGTGVAGVVSSVSGIAIQGINQTCNNSGCTLVQGTAGQFTTGTDGYILQGTGGSYGNTVFYVDALGDGYFAGNGYIAGNLTVNGTVTKGGGSFKIDHPLDPTNKYLSHSFVESPDMMNVYNGMARLDAKGEAWVNLPDYFEALNGDFRYQLTAIGAPAPRLYVAQEVSRNRFKIAGGRAGGRVSWQVTGIRHDAYANAHRIPVAEDKPSPEQGRYLHPDVFAPGAVTIAH